MRKLNTETEKRIAFTVYNAELVCGKCSKAGPDICQKSEIGLYWKTGYTNLYDMKNLYSTLTSVCFLKQKSLIPISWLIPYY